jgi:hypothetical protein
MGALSAKVVAGGVVAALAAGSATAAIAATGSLSPVNWGQHVVQTVERCKDELRGTQGTTRGDPDRGIGQCVSPIARQHGEQRSDQHARAGGQATVPSPSPTSSAGKHLGQLKNGPPTATGSSNAASSHGNGQAKGQGNGNGAGHGNGHPAHPTPAAGG